RHLGHGSVEFLGRVDDQVKIRGYRVEPAEIQAALLGHPAIRQAAVVPQGEGYEKILVAYVVSADETVSVQEVRRFLEETLPPYLVPTMIVPLETLPLT